MGGSKSKVLTDIVNRTTAEVIVENMQQCQANSSQDQSNISQGGISLFNTQTQELSLNLSCAANFQMNTDIVQKIANKIQQEAEAKSVALLDLVSGSRAEANLYLKNEIGAKVSTQLVQNTVVSLKQSQEMGAISNRYGTAVQVGNIQKQSADAVVEAIMESVANTSLATNIVNNTSQTATASQENPLDFLTGWVKWVAIFFVVLLVVIFGTVIYGFFGSDDNSNQENN